MCRMLIAVGDADIATIAEDFKRIASDKNETHENNIDKDFEHGDGWGVVYLADDQLKMQKSIIPYYEDPGVEKVKDIKSPLFILHARKKSDGKGLVRMENVHPFRYDNYVFCHNGTVNEDLLFEEKFTPQGETDSERLFYYIISYINGEMNENILSDKLNRVNDFSGMNSIMSDGKISYVVNWYAKKPGYYTFKMLVKENFLIISSEILPSYGGEQWTKTRNHDIIKLHTHSRKYSIINGGRDKQ